MAAPHFSQHILKHRLIYAQFDNQLLEPTVLVLQQLHLPDLVRFQDCILLFPSTEDLLAGSGLMEHFCNRHPDLGLFKQPDDLLHGKPSPLHHPDRRP